MQIFNKPQNWNREQRRRSSFVLKGIHEGEGGTLRMGEVGEEEWGAGTTLIKWSRVVRPPGSGKEDLGVEEGSASAGALRVALLPCCTQRHQLRVPAARHAVAQTCSGWTFIHSFTIELHLCPDYHNGMLAVLRPSILRQLFFDLMNPVKMAQSLQYLLMQLTTLERLPSNVMRLAENISTKVWT